MEEGLNLTPILIPLLAILVGWAIGFFDSNLRTSKKIKQAEDSAKAAIEAAERKTAQVQASAPTANASDGDPGLMRIRNENGRLTLDLDGARMNTSALTAEQRKRLIDMLTAIRPWLEGKPASPPPAQPTPPSQPAPAAGASPTPPPRSVQPASATRPVPTAKRNVEEPEAVPTSIVGQINMILQARIAHTPLATPGIILLESPTGGVNVYIGMEKYEGVDAVPDEEVKSAIRAAIAEWETKFTPGL
jgi:hypothetical protein